MNRAVVQLHADASCTQPLKNLLVLLRSGLLQADHSQMQGTQHVFGHLENLNR